jgi:transposase
MSGQRIAGVAVVTGGASGIGAACCRKLAETGATVVVLDRDEARANAVAAKHRPWLTALLTRRPTKVAAIALANKIARMAWAMMARGERYKEPAALAA